MADPTSGEYWYDLVVQSTDPENPQATTPRTFRLYLTGANGDDYPILKYLSDAGGKVTILVTEDANGKDVPYMEGDACYPSILSMSSDLLYMILDGNLILGTEDGSSTTNRRIIFVTGASAGTIELAANGSDDGLQHIHYLPQTDAATEGQVLAASSITGGGTIHQLDYQTADVCLARGVSVDLNITTKQTLYTVPTGRSCIITKVVQRDASAAVTTATGSYGFNAGASDVIALFNVFTNMTATTVYDPKTVVGPATKGASANTFGFKATTAEGAARTMVVDVFGYLL